MVIVYSTPNEYAKIHVSFSFIAGNMYGKVCNKLRDLYYV
jgi:hypothetical protein